MVIRRLLGVDATARPAELALLSEDVLDDLEAALADAQTLELDLRGHPEACAFASDGISAARDGHWGERKFFSKANALAGLLLLVGWLREFRWLNENHRQVFAHRGDRAE
jgi:hypothetical protein